MGGQQEISKLHLPLSGPAKKRIKNNFLIEFNLESLHRTDLLRIETLQISTVLTHYGLSSKVKVKFKVKVKLKSIDLWKGQVQVKVKVYRSMSSSSSSLYQGYIQGQGQV